MRSLSEIETTSKRASRASGFSWGVSEEVGKSVRLLEMFNFEGIKNLNEYLKEKKDKKFESLNLISENNECSAFFAKFGQLLLSKFDAIFTFMFIRNS